MEIKVIGRCVVPDKIYLHENDALSSVLVFRVNKINDGVDVSVLNGFLQIDKYGGGTDRFALTKTIGDGEVFFSLEVNLPLTQTGELLTAQLTFENSLRTVVYGTNVFNIDVKSGVDGYESYSQNMPTILKQLENRLENATNNLENAKEEFTEALDEYLQNNKIKRFVFDTEDKLNLWLQDSNNLEQLDVGDIFFIRDNGVPDYWWDGAQKLILETSIDFTPYLKASDVPGEIVKTMTNADERTWTDEEKALARKTIGAGTLSIDEFGVNSNVTGFCCFFDSAGKRTPTYLTPKLIYAYALTKRVSGVPSVSAADGVGRLAVLGGEEPKAWILLSKTKDGIDCANGVARELGWAALTGTTPPTENTVGYQIGQFYIDTMNKKAYIFMGKEDDLNVWQETRPQPLIYKHKVSFNVQYEEHDEERNEKGVATDGYFEFYSSRKEPYVSFYEMPEVEITSGYISLANYLYYNVIGGTFKNNASHVPTLKIMFEGTAYFPGYHTIDNFFNFDDAYGDYSVYKTRYHSPEFVSDVVVKDV